MLAARTVARARQCKTIWLGVYDRNVRALEFYRKFGFTQVGGKEFTFGGRIYIDPIMSASVPGAA
jgi:ribosomal protein S18 acetylase RimI-like enzyme